MTQSLQLKFNVSNLASQLQIMFQSLGGFCNQVTIVASNYQQWLKIALPNEWNSQKGNLFFDYRVLWKRISNQQAIMRYMEK